MRKSQERKAGLGLAASLAGVALFSSVISILGFTAPLFMLQVYDRVIPSGSLPTLVAFSILAIGLYAFSSFLDAIRGRMLSRVAGLVDLAVSNRVLSVIAGASLRTQIKGDILKPSQELDKIRNFLSGPGPATLLDLPWMPVYLVVCFLLHPLIGWLAAASLAILVGLTVATDILTRSRTRDAAAALSARNRFAEAAHCNAEAIATMGMLKEVQLRWAEAHGKLMRRQRRAGDVAGLFASLSKGVRHAVQSAALALGAFLVIKGDMTAGMIIAASIIVARALQPVEQVIANWRNMVAARQAWLRLKALFALFPESGHRTALPAPADALAVEAVFVAPPGERQRMTVQNVTFRARSGAAVGIIGPSASGKSSLVRAITGAWPLARGKVSLDGAGLDQWTPGELGKHIGYMPQSSDLFPGTIAENIARLDPDADDDAIVAAAQAAGVHDMIVALPDGYDSDVGDAGQNLSAGQRQRVALARALYGDPFLVVLDEPNSNLDADGDRALSEAIAGVKARGGIVVVVAHRNSVLSQVDFLLVMESGLAKAFGPRDAVLKNLQQQSQRPQRMAPAPNLVVIEGEGSST